MAAGNDTAVEQANAGDEPVVMMDYFMHLEYEEVVCPIVRRYADALMDGKILGQFSENPDSSTCRRAASAPWRASGWARTT